MKNTIYEAMKGKLDVIEDEIDITDPNDLEEKVYAFEEELTEHMQSCFPEEIDLFI